MDLDWLVLFLSASIYYLLWKALVSVCLLQVQTSEASKLIGWSSKPPAGPRIRGLEAPEILVVQTGVLCSETVGHVMWSVSGGVGSVPDDWYFSVEEWWWTFDYPGRLETDKSRNGIAREVPGDSFVAQKFLLMMNHLVPDWYPTGLEIYFRLCHTELYTIQLYTNVSFTFKSYQRPILMS